MPSGKFIKIPNNKRLFSYSAALLKAIALVLLNISGQNVSAQDKAQYMGTASCSSSNCHGSAAPLRGSDVLQNEFTTWYRHDSHSKAYSVLLNEQSKRIAYNLSIKAAEKDPLCLKCHATYVPDDSRKGQKYRVSDGVSCESCHGASGGWLKEHLASDATYQKNISSGMTDLSDIKVKTKLCLGCHIGNDDKSVNHRLIGAGHPRLTFELDTFESVMPRHWEDVKNEKNYDPASVWLKAQVIQAAERTEALYSKSRSHQGLMPEFSNMHCYSCHHSLSQKQYQSREYAGRPGEPNLNTSELWILSRAISAIDKQRSAALLGKLEALRSSFGREDITEISKQIVQMLKSDLLPVLHAGNITKDQQRRIFNELVSASHMNLQYETAEQIAMGAAAIAASNPDSDDMKEHVRELYAALDNPDLFDPLLFRKARVRKE